MNTQHIAYCAKQIETLSKGLDWLREYGLVISHENFHVAISTGHAASCDGYREAAAQLSAIALLNMPRIMAHAIKKAEDDIEVYTTEIRREADVP